jgi:hypothetical protein
VRIDLVSDTSTFCKSKISRWGKSQLVPNKPVQQVEEIHMTLHGKPTKFEAGASCT